MNTTAIKWTTLTWNPFSGCDKESPGCGFCYARRLAEDKRGTRAFPNGFDLTVRLHKLKEPFMLREPSRVFVNSMSDFFWEKVSDALRAAVIEVIRATPQHQYQILTKRAENMVRFAEQHPLPPNFWAGVSIESQDYASRVDLLRQVNVPIRFLSAEPLLGPLSLDYHGINWVIAGGESGPHLIDPKYAHRALVEAVDGKWRPRAERMDWVRRIRDEALAGGARFFFKQWGGPKSSSGGNVLDGRVWEQLPAVVASIG